MLHLTALRHYCDWAPLYASARFATGVAIKCNEQILRTKNWPHMCARRVRSSFRHYIKSLAAPLASSYPCSLRSTFRLRSTHSSLSTATAPSGWYWRRTLVSIIGGELPVNALRTSTTVIFLLSPFVTYRTARPSVPDTARRSSDTCTRISGVD